MRPLTPTSSATMLRLCPRRMPIRPFVLSSPLPSQQQQTRSKASATGADYDRQTPAFASPFKLTSDLNDTTKIPSFANYMSKRGETSNKTFQYFMVGGMGLLTAAGAKATVQGLFSWVLVEECNAPCLLERPRWIWEELIGGGWNDQSGLIEWLQISSSTCPLRRISLRRPK